VVTWPEGRQYAIFVNVAFEARAEGKAPGVSPMGNPLPGGLFDTQARSWGEYGRRRGVWNLLERASGKAPLGFSYPRGTASGRSDALVAQAGFRWFADRFDVDRPYLEQTGGRPLVILPLTMEVNDLPQRMRHGFPADVFGSRPPEGRPQRDWNRMFGAAANQAMWALLADSARGAVLDSTWPARETWEFVKADLESARVTRPRQIWCEVPLALARERYARRQPTRHPVHSDQPDDAEWEQRWALATPLPIPDTLRVNTIGSADLGPIARWCTRPSSQA
jgi:hypothetical protein